MTTKQEEGRRSLCGGVHGVCLLVATSVFLLGSRFCMASPPASLTAGQAPNLKKKKPIKRRSSAKTNSLTTS